MQYRLLFCSIVGAMLISMSACSNQQASQNSASSSEQNNSAAQSSSMSEDTYPAVQSTSAVAANSVYPAYPAESTPQVVQTAQSAYPAAETEERQFVMTLQDGSTTTVTMATLEDVPIGVVEIASGTSEGYLLGDLLLKLKIIDYTSLTITGTSGSVILDPTEVNDQVILDATSDPTQISLVFGGQSDTPEIFGIQSITVQ